MHQNRLWHGIHFSMYTLQAVSTVERPTAPDVPPPGVNITLALNANQPINVLDEPGSDALFMPKLEIQVGLQSLCSI